jgi:hypothetical protein
VEQGENSFCVFVSCAETEIGRVQCRSRVQFPRDVCVQFVSNSFRTSPACRAAVDPPNSRWKQPNNDTVKTDGRACWSWRQAAMYAGSQAREHQVRSGHSARVNSCGRGSRSPLLRPWHPGPPKHASINRSEHRVFTPRTQPGPPILRTALAASAVAFMSRRGHSLVYRQHLPPVNTSHAAVTAAPALPRLYLDARSFSHVSVRLFIPLTQHSVIVRLTHKHRTLAWP